MADKLEIAGIATPCLLLDIDRVRLNADRVSSIAVRNKVRLRPHVKTHKCVEVARIATEKHDGAITVSTLNEARAFSKHGFTDITYAVPIEPGKFSEVIQILRSGVRLHVITDDLETSRSLSVAAKNADVQLGVFLKVDCGYHRCGVSPTSDEAIEIPRQISGSSNLDFAGILTHAGHSYNARSVDQIKSVAGDERDSMVDLAGRLRRSGIMVPTVSIGSTPTINHVDRLDGIDEVRPGNYIFFDAFQATLGSCTFKDCALTVIAAVTHRSLEQKKIIIDAGGIALSKDRGPVDLDSGCGYGRVLTLDGEETGLRVNSLSQEHGTIHVIDDVLLSKFPVGSRVRILVNHSCMATAQHEFFNILEHGEIVDRWTIHRGW